MKKIIIGDVKIPEQNWILDFLEGDFIWVYIDNAVISNPYSCTMRYVISNLIQQEIVEIYVIGLNSNSNHVTSEILEEYYQKEHICVDSMKTLEYLFIQTQGCSLADWIQGLPLKTDNIRESVKLLKRHPIIPKRVKVIGYLANESEKSIIQID
ncbi:MAG: hypothetical protein AB2392_18725 [Neobacillus sp.]